MGSYHKLFQSAAIMSPLNTKEIQQRPMTDKLKFSQFIKKRKSWPMKNLITSRKTETGIWPSENVESGQ